MALDVRAKVGFLVVDADGFLSESDLLCRPVADELQSNRFAPKEDVGAGRPLTRRGRSGLVTQKLPFQPGYMFAGKLPGFNDRATSRDCHAGAAVRAQAQDVPAGSAMSDQMQFYATISDHQPAVARMSKPSRGDEKV
jgi:hypothetical protein